MASIRVALRHLYKAVNYTADKPCSGWLRIDFDKHLVYLDDAELQQRLWYNCLLCFFGILVGIDNKYMIKEIYGVGYGTIRSTPNTDGLPSRKLKKIREPRYILTEIGVGYRLQTNKKT
jgi:hypothetical protein